MRGQGLPITVIIVAALGILVLVVIGAIFGGQIFQFGRAAAECPGKCVIGPTRNVPLNAPPGAFVQRAIVSCNDFETPVSGARIAVGAPKDADLEEWKCDVCCLPTG